MKDKMKILFAEDGPMDAELVCRIISKDNIHFERKIVETEKDYLNALYNWNPDLIISDYSMPQFDGMTALRLRNEIAHLIPFILVTGSINEEIAVECIRGGADDYLIKKNLTRLGPAIRAVVDKKKTLREKELVETHLRDVNEFNNSLLRTIPFGMDIVDEEGTVLFQSEKLMNITRLNGVGQKCWDLYRDDKKQCSDCPLVKGIRIGETDVYESSGVLGGKIYDIIHTGMIYNGKKAMLEIFLDITERKRMEEKVIKSEAYYRALTDLSPDGIIITDYEGRVRYISKKTYDMFGILREENLTGQSVLKWVSPDYHGQVISRIAELISGRDIPEVREYKLLRNDGTVFWGELASSAIPGSNGISDGLLVVCRDITERKRVADELLRAKEKAEEGDRLKTAFLHNISHEIRTPMNAIVGFSALLSEPDIENEIRNSYVDVIINSSNHLLVLLNDIIDIANIEAGIVKTDIQPVSLKEIMMTLYSQFYPRSMEKGISLMNDKVIPDWDSVILTDRTRLQQIMSNLISNAIKFTERGAIRFGYNRIGENIEFFVSDSGIGIAEEHQLKIFDRFYQVENPASKLYEGLGLGLAITKSYVGLLGGEIHVSSSPGSGSRFHFTLPIQKPDRQSDKKDATDEEFIFPETKTILVAEDIESNFRLIRQYLADCNLKIIHAPDGRSAVDKCLDNGDVDLVLMDVRMPLMDGYSAARLILEQEPDMPIIIQTAFAEDHESAIRCGCAGFLTKPFSRSQLIRVLKDLL